MALFAGAYSIGGKKPLDSNLTDLLRKNIAISEGNLETFSGTHFLLTKYDFGAFGESGYLTDNKKGMTAAIAGEPILIFEDKESYSRLTDLRTISKHLSQGNIDVLRSCHGTYSVCYYNSSKHALILATDKIGARPVYYYINNDFLYFASCLKILEAIDRIPRRTNISTFIEQHVFGEPLGNKTLYSDIKVLRDGQYIKCANDNIEISYYFRWDQLPVTDKSQDEILQESYKAFRSAVASRSKRSHSFFSFLSGGLDSRCVVSILNDLGKDIIAFNWSKPGSQEQIFAEQYAKRIGIRYFSSNRLKNDIWGPQRLFEEADRTINREVNNMKYSRLIFSGDGGSIVGFIHQDKKLLDLLKEGKDDSAINHFLKHKKKIPRKIIQSDIWRNIRNAPFYGMKKELEKLKTATMERFGYLFLLENHERGHLHTYYENIDKYKFELVMPFCDSRLIEIITGAPTPLEHFLYHNFYHKWLQLFPETTRLTPWQTYPGHCRCPLPDADRGVHQWQINQQDEYITNKPLMQKCLRIVRKRNFPNEFLRRPILFLAILLHNMKIRNYSYIFQFCVNFYEHRSKCTSMHIESGDH